MFLGMGLAAYGVIVTYADPLILFLLVYNALLWIAAPCAAVALIILLFAAISRRWLRPPLLLLSAVLAAACVLAAALPINEFLQERAVTAAKAYPDRVASLLEQYRREHGAYPARLEQLPSRPHVPRLLRSSYGYKSNGEHYDFSFSQPGGMIDVWEYNSEAHAWHLST
jgi:hypothetical protein